MNDEIAMTKLMPEGILVIQAFGIVSSFVIRASPFFSTPRRPLGFDLPRGKRSR